jgi:hypothetical protein
MLLLSAPLSAWSRPVNMMDGFPAAQVIVGHTNAQYVVRFDGPVDHHASRLTITQRDRMVESLTPRLDAAPEVLLAFEPRLPAGEDESHWSAKAMPDGDFSDGSIRFTIAG